MSVEERDEIIKDLSPNAGHKCVVLAMKSPPTELDVSTFRTHDFDCII